MPSLAENMKAGAHPSPFTALSFTAVWTERVFQSLAYRTIVCTPNRACYYHSKRQTCPPRGFFIVGAARVLLLNSFSPEVIKLFSCSTQLSTKF